MPSKNIAAREGHLVTLLCTISRLQHEVTELCSSDALPIVDCANANNSGKYLSTAPRIESSKLQSRQNSRRPKTNYGTAAEKIVASC